MANWHNPTPSVCTSCGVDYPRFSAAMTTKCAPCARAEANREIAAARRKNYPRSLVYFNTCPNCLVLFTTRTKRRAWCSTECRRSAARRERQGQRASDREITCEDCATSFTIPHKAGTQRRFCDTCRLAHVKVTRKAQKARRRALKRGLTAELVSPSVIYRRDGWRCGICERPVSQRLTYPHPESPSLDHIVPLAFGGTHEPSNLQCAHLRCNLVKGARADSVQLRLA